MPVTTYHQFIDKYPVRPNDTRLILGTIHPHNVDRFLLPFFYGNGGYFWSLLQSAFPCCNFGSLPQIIQILNNSNVWISNIIRRCDRSDAGIVKDEDLYNLQINCEQIRAGIIGSKIEEIYFTSGFGRNNTARLFTNTFNIDYQATYSHVRREFIIPKYVFGRIIKGVVLYSPSPNASRGIGRSPCYKAWLKELPELPITPPTVAFRIKQYKENLSFLNCQ